MKLILAYKSFVPDGVSHIGLGVTASATAAVLHTAGVQAEVWAVLDGYDLEKRLKAASDVAFCVLEAPWVDIPFCVGMAGRLEHITFCMTCHSNVAFLQSDAFAAKCMRLGAIASLTTPNFHVAGNSAKFCIAMQRAFGADCPQLPNLYPLTGYPQEKRFDGKTLRIGMFGATRVLKNMMTGAWAALILARQWPVELHISSGRTEGGAGVLASINNLLADNPRITLIQDAWANWETFKQNVSSMHLLFQPTFTESFNMVTADGVSVGVPSIVSPVIDWTPRYWQADPDDATAFVTAARHVLRHPTPAGDGHRALAAYNTAGVPKWLRFLGHN